MLLSIGSPRTATVLFLLCVLFFLYFSFSYKTDGIDLTSNPLSPERPNTHASRPSKPLQDTSSAEWAKQAEEITQKAKEITDSPVLPPYKLKFGEVGSRARSLRQWVQFLDDARDSAEKDALRGAVEAAISTTFPYIRDSPRLPGSVNPFADLRGSFVLGSKGIVIPTGKGTMRLAAHLIGALQQVIKTKLPMLVVYGGEKDFPEPDRAKLRDRFPDLQFLDILSVVDDTTLKLEDGGWAIKAFAALYAPFEQVILTDADSVFVQPPEKFFEDPSYTSTGALLFHDRLLWQHAQPHRTEWFHSQIHEPSATLNKSLMWTEDYSEECDSGAVVLNKSKLDVLIGLLHIGWQNSKEVRDEATYRMTYGDKESFWFGLELSGAEYAFEKHYGSMVGWPSAPENGGEDKICSFYIGHVDLSDELFWYNGGLLRFKRGPDPHDFGLPTHLMVDGEWHKDGSVEEESCMDKSKSKKLPDKVIGVLDKSIALAKELDGLFGY